MRLISGAAGTGKTALILNEFAAALRANPAAQLRIIAPTATLVRHLRHELARQGLVFPPDSVISLHRFIAQCAGEQQAVAPTLLRLIARDCLLRLRLPEFTAVFSPDPASSKSSSGFPDTVVETVNLLENSGCTSQRFAAVRHAEPLSRAFAKLWTAVEEGIHHRGLLTRPEYFRAAAAGIPPDLRIWMDGFLNLSPLEEEFVAALSRKADLTLTLGAAANPRMQPFAVSRGASHQIIEGSPRRPAVTVVAAAAPEREAEEIARRIIELHAAGTPFRRIALALRDNATYLTLLEATLERFGIPARSYFSAPLDTHPLARFAAGLINGALEGWEYEAALETFRLHPRWGRSSAFDRFDFAVREAMPGHGAAGFVSHAEAPWLRDDLTACTAIDAWTTLRERPAAWARRFERMLNALYRPAALPDPADHHAVAAARSHVAARGAWLQAIELAVQFFDSEQPLPLATFWRAAALAIADTAFQLPDDRADVVHLMSVYEARQWDVSALFVCGMTDRDFPARRPQNLFFSETRLEKLPASLFLRKPLLREQQSDERSLFDALRSRASTALVFTCPTHDASGRSVSPSRFLEDLPVTTPAMRAVPALPAAQTPGRHGRLASNDALAELVLRHRTVGTTALEDLAQCRFKFFAAKALRLEGPPERPADRLHARVTGIILHKALELWQSDRTRDFVTLFDEAFVSTCREENLPPGYRLECERLRFRNIAHHVHATEQWHADSTEVEVSLTLPLSGGVTVNTRIDRVDRIGDQCIIVDYKSGKTKNIQKKLQSLTHLQGPLYALAVREHRGLTPAAVLFWAVRDDELHGWGHIPNAPDAVNRELSPMPPDWATAARARIEARLAGYLEGNVTAEPEDPDQCRWCDFAATCRVGQEEPQPFVRIAGVPLE